MLLVRMLKEEEEAQQAMTATPDGPRPVDREEPEPITAVSRRRMSGTGDVQSPAVPSSLSSGGHHAASSAFEPSALGQVSGIPSPGHVTGPPPLAGGTGTVRDNGQGFWSRLFRKKRRSEPPGEG